MVEHNKSEILFLNVKKKILNLENSFMNALAEFIFH